MEIIQLHLKHFGRFTDYRLDLHAGINIISGANETGKSTLHAFIRAMLYGISRNRSRSLDEYQLREPWENPSYFAGSMKLLYEGKIYRIDRNFYKREERVEVVCETDGTRAEDPQAAISAFLGGLSGEDFDNTIYIRQAQAPAGGKLSESLRNCMVNLEHAEDASLDVSTAQEYLKKKKKAQENAKKSALEEIGSQLQEKERESEYINRDLERLLEKRLDENANRTEPLTFERVGGAGKEAEAEQSAGGAGKEAEAEQSAGAGKEEEAERAAKTDSMPEQAQEETEGVLLPVAVFLSFVTAALMIACAFLTTDVRMRYAAIAGAVLIGIVACSLLLRILHPISREERIRKRQKREEFLNRHLGFRDPDPDEDYGSAETRERELRPDKEAKEQAMRADAERELERRQEEDRKQLGRDAERIARAQMLDREISLRRQKLDELREEQEALYRKKAELSSYDEEIQAIELAQNRIRELSGNIVHESGADFEKEVSALLSGLTDGHYTRISLDEKNMVLLNTPDKLLTLDQVSHGTMQQVYFALRLAAAGLLSGESQVPVILDEPFAMYDEKRLASALRILSGCGRQVILFTCQTRELDLLSDMGLA